LGVAPIFAISIKESQSRAPSTRTFDKSAISRELQRTFVDAIIGLTNWSNGVTLSVSAHQFGAAA
jgi:hypothetical protein